MRKILVTGGAGYIGSHTAAQLLEQGFDVVVADNLSNSHPVALRQIEAVAGRPAAFERVDLTDARAVAGMWARHPQIDAVIHFAALKAVGDSVRRPLDYYRNNILSLVNVLDEAVRRGAGRFIFSSSCTVYGQPELLPVTERTPLGIPESPYGSTKLVGERILADLVASGVGMNVMALRYFNPIGAHPSGLLGELPLGVPGNLVPYVTQTAYGIRPELKIFGNDYDTPCGTCVRDFIDINDLASAHLAALRRIDALPSAGHFEAYNVGTGSGVSVRELVETFQSATGVAVPHSYAPRRPGDIAKIWADTTLAREVLGWSARVPLADTLRSAWLWERTFRERIEPAME